MSMIAAHHVRRILMYERLMLHSPLSSSLFTHLLSCPTSQSHPCAIAEIEVIASKSEHILEGLAPYSGAGGAGGGGPRVCVGVVTGRASTVHNDELY